LWEYNNLLRYDKSILYLIVFALSFDHVEYSVLRPCDSNNPSLACVHVFIFVQGRDVLPVVRQNCLLTCSGVRTSGRIATLDETEKVKKQNESHREVYT
jgi:hypothetical protein